jgi:hypothetical protein
MKQLLAGVVVGVIALAAVRFVFVPVERPTHYHANFAVFVEGRRLDLSGDRFMEELGACKVSGLVLPSSRAHLHNHNPDVVHVHHDGVTWGHLLANLGFGLGDRYLALSDGKILEEGNGKTLKFVLNGREQSSVANELIRSGDRLLISYGPESAAEVARSQFPAVASTAEEFNRKNDPAGCSGPGDPTLWDRVRHAFLG